MRQWLRTYYASVLKSRVTTHDHTPSRLRRGLCQNFYGVHPVARRALLKLPCERGLLFTELQCLWDNGRPEVSQEKPLNHLPACIALSCAAFTWGNDSFRHSQGKYWRFDSGHSVILLQSISRALVFFQQWKY